MNKCGINKYMNAIKDVHCFLFYCCSCGYDSRYVISLFKKAKLRTKLLKDLFKYCYVKVISFFHLLWEWWLSIARCAFYLSKGLCKITSSQSELHRHQETVTKTYSLSLWPNDFTPRFRLKRNSCLCKSKGIYKCVYACVVCVSVCV